jgi:CheY-like chemotaxis protein
MNHILLVDDDNVHHVVTSMLIKRLPFHLESSKAMDGREAIDQIKADLNNPPSLVLLDLNMPVMNGWEFLEEMNELIPKMPRQPVICILSSTIAPDDIERSKSYPTVHSFISKPLLKKDMIELLTSLGFEQKE